MDKEKSWRKVSRVTSPELGTIPDVDVSDDTAVTSEMNWRTATSLLHHFLGLVIASDSVRLAPSSFAPGVFVKAVVMTPEQEGALTFLLCGQETDPKSGLDRALALAQLSHLDDKIWDAETFSVDGHDTKQVFMTLDDIQAFKYLLEWAKDAPER